MRARSGRQESGNPLKQGWSTHTPHKQALFVRIMRQQASIVAGMQRRNPHVGWLLYLDLFSGSGISEDGSLGSPLLARQVLKASGALWEMRCYEKNPDHAERLEGLLDHDEYGEAPVWCGDCRELVPAWLRSIAPATAGQYRGVCYVDPNGDVPWDLLTLVAQRLPKVDLLIHLSATLIKRQRECSRLPGRCAHLADYLALVPKQHWLTTELDGAHHWQLLLGSNWPDQPGIKGCSFVPVASERGQAIFRRANYTKDELPSVPIEGQLALIGSASWTADR